MARGCPPSRSICSARAPACFDVAVSGKTVQWLMRVPLHVLQMYSNLVTFPRGNLTQPRPEVAQSWDVSQDARTYTFHLKRGIVFSSGNPLTADDVLYSFQRVVNLPKDPASWLITQTGIDDRNVASAVQAPDPYTVVITLPKPFSPGAFLDRKS